MWPVRGSLRAAGPILQGWANDTSQRDRIRAPGGGGGWEGASVMAVHDVERSAFCRRLQGVVGKFVYPSITAGQTFSLYGQNLLEIRRSQGGRVDWGPARFGTVGTLPTGGSGLLL